MGNGFITGLAPESATISHPEGPTFKVTAYLSPNDGCPVIEIDTVEGTDEIRVYVNDGQIFAGNPEEGDNIAPIALTPEIEKLIQEGYTGQEAQLLTIIHQYANEHPKFGARYGHGRYSAADIVGILAPMVTVLESPRGIQRHNENERG